MKFQMTVLIYSLIQLIESIEILIPDQFTLIQELNGNDCSRRLVLWTNPKLYTPNVLQRICFVDIGPIKILTGHE